MLKFTALPTPLPTIAEGADPNPGNTLIKQVTAPNSFPCRRCLHDGEPGDEMYLFSYNPFKGSSPYTVASPIFVHVKDCTRYQCDGSVPDQQRKRMLAVRAYDRDHMMVKHVVLSGEELGNKAEELLDGGDAEYLHVYYAAPGCFAVRIDRAM